MAPKNRKGIKRRIPNPEDSPAEKSRVVRRRAESRNDNIQEASISNVSNGNEVISSPLSNTQVPSNVTVVQNDIAQTESLRPDGVDDTITTVAVVANRQARKGRSGGRKTKRSNPKKSGRKNKNNPNPQNPKDTSSESGSESDKIKEKERIAGIAALLAQIPESTRQNLEQKLNEASPFYNDSAMFTIEERKTMGINFRKRQFLQNDDPMKEQIRERMNLPSETVFDVVKKTPEKIRLPTDIPDNALVIYLAPIDAGRWNLGIVYAYIPKFDVYVIEDSFYDTQKYFVTPSKYVGRIYSENRVIDMGRPVIAMYPSSSLFYKGMATSQHFYKYRVTFDPEGGDGKIQKDIDSHYVFNEDRFPLPDNWSEWLSANDEIEALKMAPSCRTRNLPIMGELPDHLIVSEPISPSTSRDINYLQRTGLITETPFQVQYSHPFRQDQIVLVRSCQEPDWFHFCAVATVSDTFIHCKDLSGVDGSHTCTARQLREFPDPTSFVAGKKVNAKHPDRPMFYPAILLEDKGPRWLVEFQIQGKKKVAVHKAFIVQYREPSEADIRQCAHYKRMVRNTVRG